MDSLTTNTPAPTVSTEATQPVQQAQPDKSARFKEKAENQASKVMAEIEKLQKLSNKKYYTYSTELIIPELSEPPVRTLGATIPENESHIFR